MNAISFEFSERRRSLPVVLLIDPQAIDGAPDQTSTIDRASAIEQCRVALAFARRHGFPIAMTRWRSSGSRFRGWLEGLEPHASEMVFDQPRASSYSSGTFTEMMVEGGGGHNAVLACPVSIDACIATAADAVRRGHRVTLLADASAALPPEGAPGADVQVATRIHQHCHSMTTRTWMSSELAALRREIGG